MDANNVNALWNGFVLFLPRLGGALLVFLAFWLLARIVEGIVRRVLSRRPMSPDLVQLVGQVMGITLVVFGAVTALGTLGIDTGAMVAGLGLTGFALGFALKDMISNFLAGFMILLYEPFMRGDRIRVGDHEGTVVEVNLRYTVLDASERRILIPNANLLTNAVVIHRLGAGTGQS
jgi:small-conductance mechanosensitive channel